MREIKFRSFTGIGMEYNVIAGKFGHFYVNPSNNGIDVNDTACLTPFNTKYPETVPLMQFTGLCDKNGKDIYEGDRIKDGETTGIVKWLGCSFMVEWDADCYSDLLGWENYKRGIISDGSSYEVIGNIYEK